MATKELPKIKVNGEDAEGITVEGVVVALTTPEPRYGTRALIVGDYTIRMAQDLVRQAANVAVKALRSGKTGPEAAIAAIYGVDHADPSCSDSEYLAYTIANVTMGKCPDGCCGPGADMPFEEAGDAGRKAQALHEAHGAFHAARKLGEAS